MFSSGPRAPTDDDSEEDIVIEREPDDLNDWSNFPSRKNSAASAASPRQPFAAVANPHLYVSGVRVPNALSPAALSPVRTDAAEDTDNSLRSESGERKQTGLLPIPSHLQQCDDGFDQDDLIIYMGSHQNDSICIAILQLFSKLSATDNLEVVLQLFKETSDILNKEFEQRKTNSFSKIVEESKASQLDEKSPATVIYPTSPLMGALRFSISRSPSPNPRARGRSRSVSIGDPSALIESSTLTEIHEALAGFAITSVYRKALHVIEKYVLRLLPLVQKDLEHWTSIRTSPWSYFFQRGPVYFASNFVPGSRTKLSEFSTGDGEVEPHSFFLKLVQMKDREQTVVVPSGIIPWMRYVNFAGQLHVEDKIEFLSLFRSSLEIFLGQIHHEFVTSTKIRTFGGKGKSSWTADRLKNRIVTMTTYLAKYRDNPFERSQEALLPYNESSSLQRGNVLQLLNEVDELAKVASSVPKALDKIRFPFRRPSHFRRYWLFYTVGFIGAGAFTYNLVYGTPGFWSWLLNTIRDSLVEFYKEHVSVPLNNIFQRLFFRRNKSQFDKARKDLRESRESLERMLLKYGQQDLQTNPELAKLLLPENAQERRRYEAQLKERSSRGDMSIVMKRYESEVSQPLWTTVRGELISGVLIQLQKLKVDTEATIVELDMLIDENDLNLQVLAIVPALMLLSPAIYLVRYQVSLRRTASSPGHREMRRCVERMLDRLICKYPAESSGIYEQAEDTGFLLWQCHQLVVTARGQRRRHLISHEDQEQILRDVKRIKALSLDVSQKRAVINKMYCTHRFLRFT
eukprot:TRINITY_DN38396_c0_g1_i1.p1 TRINITY_DN38396_c0_g1~~TRINITY_DN38396_c0_g1_i1.p1  ORF type:complete len:800 (+),score=134.60 TRINITY_DN38396_c0_g1_i1:39-2438(+)